MTNDNHAGDKLKQIVLTNTIFRIIQGHHPVDVVGALQTLICNCLIYFATDEQQAMRGLRACFGDMRDTIKRHYENERSSERGPGEAS